MKVLLLILTAIVNMLIGQGELVGMIPNTNGGSATVYVGKDCVEIGFLTDDHLLQHEYICDFDVERIEKMVVAGSGDYLHVSIQEDGWIHTYAVAVPENFSRFRYEQPTIIYFPIFEVNYGR